MDPKIKHSHLIKALREIEARLISRDAEVNNWIAQSNREKRQAQIWLRERDDINARWQAAAKEYIRLLDLKTPTIDDRLKLGAAIVAMREGSLEKLEAALEMEVKDG